MAEGYRRSKRGIKPKKDENFLYEEDFGALYEESATVQQQQQQCSDSECSDRASESAISVNCVRENWKVQSAPSFSIIENLPLFNDLNVFSSELVSGRSAVSNLANQSQSQNTIPQSVKSKVQFSSANINVNKYCDSGREQRISSSREDFLDLEGNYLSCGSSSTVEDMSGTDDGASGLPIVCKVCGIGENDNCAECAKVQELPMGRALMAALGKIDSLSSKFNSLCEVVMEQNSRLSQLEIVKSDSESGSDQAKALPSKSVGKNKTKKKVVDDEKDRLHVVVQDHLRSMKKGKEKTEREDLSQEELLISDLLKTMQKGDKKKCSSRVKAILQDVGGILSEDDSDAGSSSSSGKESDASSRRRTKKKVKSGAKVKRRPVIKTELWPHTMAYEEDGIEVSCEDITLSKFYSCFTLIMAGCEGDELSGRSALLRGVSMVLDVLPWPEARTFHNLAMVKIEQGKIDWKHKFSLLANEFVDKKVRQNLRAKAYAPGGGYSGRGNSAFRGTGRGAGNYNGNRGQAGGNRPFNVVCWQWNNGNCTYGERCRRMHCCRICADRGKWGELHTASSSFHQGNTWTRSQ